MPHVDMRGELGNEANSLQGRGGEHDRICSLILASASAGGSLIGESDQMSSTRI